MDFKKLVENKRVLHVPIYSMFNRETGKVNLLCDGNVNRCLTAWTLNSTFKSLEVMAPSKEASTNFEKFEELFSTIKNADLKKTAWIQKSALFQRSSESASGMFDEIVFNHVGLIIFESQQLGVKLIEKCPKSVDLVYWCPVCATSRKTRSFLEKDKELNEKLFRSSRLSAIIVASKDQVEYLRELGIDEDRICFWSQHIDRTLPMFNYVRDETVASLVKHILKHKEIPVYLPFRLSDEGYKLGAIMKTVANLPDPEKVCLIYPNLNNVSIWMELSKWFEKEGLDYREIDRACELLERGLKISSSRDTFYTILDNFDEVVIPYFEDLDFINHSTIQELFDKKKLPKCKVVTNEEELSKCLREML